MDFDAEFQKMIRSMSASNTLSQPTTFGPTRGAIWVTPSFPTRVVEVMCDYCFAKPWEFCVTASGKKASYPHAGRWEIANGYRPSVYLIHEQP